MRLFSPVLALALALVPALAAGVAQARAFEENVYLHDINGLHLTPPNVYAKVGDTITLRVENDGEADHNLYVCGDASSPSQSCQDIWGFTPMIAPGGAATLVVEAKRAGTFDYYCAVPGHKGSAPGAHGSMWGQLVVQAESAQKPAPAAPVALVALALAGLALALRRRSA